MASDLSSGCMETIDILDDEKEEGEISLEDVSSSEENGMGHLTCGYVVGKTRKCPNCKSWPECASWCTTMYHSKSRRDPVKGKENQRVKEEGCTVTKHAVPAPQEKNNDLVPISSDSDLEIVGLADTSNRSKARVKKKKRKKKDYKSLTIDDLISPSSPTIDTHAKEFSKLKTLYREVSPVHKNNRLKMMLSVRRHRSPVKTRSPLKDYSRSPIRKKSPRRLARSPKRSPLRRSPVRIARKLPRQDSPTRKIRSHVDKHDEVTRLLKRVKRLDSTHTSETSANRGKEHQSSSLMEKLTNMFKRVPDNDHDTTHLKKSKDQAEPVNRDEEAEDEEDLALLRQKALETKQKKSNRPFDRQADTEMEKEPTDAKNDDQDEEALQLRMIALRSAIMKKHQNRVRRGIRARRTTRSESPFSQSFLEDVPAPSNELLQFASPPCTPPQNSNHTEDMELDTDVEREKEKLPYSPTDKIVSIDAAMLGIELSDVSFINVNTSPIFNDTRQNEEMLLPSTDRTSPYYSKFVVDDPKPSENYCYSLSQKISEIFPTDMNTLTNNPKDFHSNSVMYDLIDDICCQGGETHHLSTDTTVTDTTCVLPGNENFPRTSIHSAHPSSVTFGYAELISSSNGSTIIHNLPRETETDPESSGSSERSAIGGYVPKPSTSSMSCDQQVAAEGEAMEQDVPDCNKTSNKIPTLINRKPVHVRDLNKQPSPVTRVKAPSATETQPEMTLKSAEMQLATGVGTDVMKKGKPVEPVRLQLTKKPTLPTPAALDTSESSESVISEIRSGDSASTENKHKANKPEYSADADTTHASSAENNAEISSERKMRKRAKKNPKIIEVTSESIDHATQSHKKDEKSLDNDANKTDVNTELDKGENNNNNNKNSRAQEKYTNNEASSKCASIVETEKKHVPSNCSIIEAQNEDTKQNNHLVSSINGEKRRKEEKLSQEKNIESRCSSTNNTSVKMRKNADDRKSSVDDDENALRAILLASLKRTKATNTNVGSTLVAPSVVDTVTCSTTSIQTPMQKSPLPSPVSSAISAMSNNVPQSSSTELLSSPGAYKRELDNNVSTSVLRKRSAGSVLVTKGPLKKMIKKAPIPASTKVLNNAKKYQNMIVQRKLNLRKLDNARNSAKPNEWPKTSLRASETQRFVISLGSDTDSESESEKCCKDALPRGEHQGIQDDFEKSVQKFLRDMRKEQEQSAAAAAAKPALSPHVGTNRDASPASTQTDKSSTNVHTPLAVRHLPVSQQEEYRRLKQQIWEREKLKLQRTVAHNTSKDNNSNNSNNSRLLNANADPPIKSPVSENNTTHVTKQNQIKLKELETGRQQSQELRKRSVDIMSKNIPLLNASRASFPVKHVSENIVKYTNSQAKPVCQAKEIKKTIPTNLSIRITNEIAPSHVVTVGSKPIDNSNEKQSDKQQHRVALRVLNKDEINHKNVQVMLKVDKIGSRVVTLNDNKLSILHDTHASTSQSEKSIENNVSIESLNERDKNNENTSVFASNASTEILSENLSVSSNAKKQELDDTLETTMSRSQYEAECQRESNRNISVSPTLDNNSSNNFSRPSEVSVDNDKGDEETPKKDAEIEAELNSLANLSEAEQQQYLRDAEHKLVAKRYNVLDHLAEMSGNLRQWDMEKDLQSSLAAEVKKLRDQLKMAEKRLQKQRDRVNSMGLKVLSARQKINNGRQEYFKLSKICLALGNRFLGKNYRLPEAGGQLLNDKFKEVVGHARQFTKKKRSQSNETVSGNCNSNLPQQTSAVLEVSKAIHAEENLSLQKQPADAGDLKSNILNLKQLNENENLLISELSLTFSNQMTPVKRKETSTNIRGPRSDEQISLSSESSMLPSVSKLNSIPFEQNNEHSQKTQSVHISDIVTTSEFELPAADSSLQIGEQSNKRTIFSLPPPTQQMQTTLTTTKTTTITPYVSILTHLKTPRNTNPHGVLCPFEIMGICRDEDCEYIHQSRNQT